MPCGGAHTLPSRAFKGERAKDITILETVNRRAAALLPDINTRQSLPEETRVESGGHNEQFNMNKTLTF